jgi:hypothetical protein
MKTLAFVYATSLGLIICSVTGRGKPNSNPVVSVPPPPPPLTAVVFPKESYWPDQVHLTKPAKLTTPAGRGSIIFTVPAGTEVWAFVQDDKKNLKIQKKDPDLEGLVPIEDTDFLDVARSAEAKREAAKIQSRNALLLTQKKLEAQKKNDFLTNLQTEYAMLELSIPLVNNSEREDMIRLIKEDKIIIDKYNTFKPEDIKNIIGEYDLFKENLYSNKKINGYAYNEFVKKQIPKRIRFDMYSNTNEFYLQVGDGDFSTVVTMNTSDIVALYNTSDKVNNWARQCFSEKMDTRKPVAMENANISLTFVSKNNGGNSYIELAVMGKYSKNSMITEQRVMLDLMNYNSLIYRIRNINKILSKRQSELDNADRLR